MALGALAVYWLAEAKLRQRTLAACFALAYLLFPAMQYMNMEDFHSEIFATPLILFALCFLERKKVCAFFAFIVAALAAKENIALAIFPLGIYIAIAQKKVKIGILASALAAAFFIFNIYFFMPMFSSSGFRLLSYEQGSSLPEIALGILQHPLAAIASALQFQKLAYLVLLVAPLGIGISLLAPEILLVAVPALAANLLSTAPQRSSIFFHYNEAIVPLVFFAAIIGMSRLMRQKNSRFAAAGMALIIASGILGTILIGPLAYTPFENYNFLSEHSMAGREMLSLIPKAASVSATNNAVAHLSQREQIFVFPNPFHKVWYLSDRGIAQPDYVLIDLVPGKEGIYTPEEFAGYAGEIAGSKEYKLIGSRDSWVLYRRVE
jgi:uncharacterized membrane protein